MPTKQPPDAPQSQDFAISQGTSGGLEVTVNGLGISIAGAQITCLVKINEADLDANAVITKTVGNGGIVITQNGSATLPAIFQILFAPGDTQSLAVQSYEYDCKIKIGSDIYVAIERSHFDVEAVITQAVV